MATHRVPRLLACPGSRLACMAMTVDLPDELARALEAEAAQRGVSVDALIAESVAEHLGTSASRRRLALSGVGASGDSRHSARDADEMLAEGFGRD